MTVMYECTYELIAFLDSLLLLFVCVWGGIYHYLCCASISMYICVQSASRALGSMAPTTSDTQAGLLSTEVNALTKLVTQFHDLN